MQDVGVEPATGKIADTAAGEGTCTVSQNEKKRSRFESTTTGYTIPIHMPV
jgi:hypothetical protein